MWHHRLLSKKRKKKLNMRNVGHTRNLFIGLDLKWSSLATCPLPCIIRMICYWSCNFHTVARLDMCIYYQKRLPSYDGKPPNCQNLPFHKTSFQVVYIIWCFPVDLFQRHHVGVRYDAEMCYNVIFVIILGVVWIEWVEWVEWVGHSYLVSLSQTSALWRIQK